MKKIVGLIVFILVIIAVVLGVFYWREDRTHTHVISTDNSSISKYSQKSVKTAIPIQVTIDGHQYKAHLYENATGSALAKRLPQTLSFDTFSSGFDEKIADLPSKVSTKGMPAGADADAGDIGYWSPQPRVVLYYGHVDRYDGIHIIGKFDDQDAVNAIKNQHGSFKVTIHKGN
ncbi:cyclophilin-like fold protein [Pediococcus siamensis]|uniref:cyclophilin-like fold protein n=1 Tax=Pediococcus siamensis TaxID=381829 RepID=UPI0039A36846